MSAWNGKVITTANQWNWNANGSAEPMQCDMADILASYRDAYETDNYWMEG